MAEKYSIKHTYISYFTYLSSVDKYTFCSLSVVNNEVTTWEHSYLIDLVCFENKSEMRLQSHMEDLFVILKSICIWFLLGLLRYLLSKF